MNCRAFDYIYDYLFKICPGKTHFLSKVAFKEAPNTENVSKQGNSIIH
jgi:hypothetical protein